MSLDTLRQIVDLSIKRDRIGVHLAEQVQKARAEGESWQTIGDALGVSKQAAQQRYGRLLDQAENDERPSPVT